MDMPDPDVDANARATELREQIEKLDQDSKGSRGAGESQGKNAGKPLSPREFINKRMAELDKKKDT